MLFADEVVDPDALDELPAADDVEATKRELDIAKQLIESLAGRLRARQVPATATASRCSTLDRAQGRRRGDRRPAARRGGRRARCPTSWRAEGEPRRGARAAPATSRRSRKPKPQAHAAKAKAEVRRRARRPPPRARPVARAAGSRAVRAPSTAAAADTAPPRLRQLRLHRPRPRRGVSRGRGFAYLDPDGERVERRARSSTRIDELVIPPAWQDVWICPYPGGHIQATGIDAAGRKQYLYHPRWRERRDQEKFDDMVDFARALPALRERVDADLRARGRSAATRVLACAVRLLDRGFFRIGAEDYAVHERDLRAGDDAQAPRARRGDGVRLRLPGQERQAPRAGGRRPRGRRRSSARSSAAAAAATSCWPTRRGRRWVDVRSRRHQRLPQGGHRRATSRAKDFRTWGATVLAAVALAVAGAGAEHRRPRASARSRARSRRSPTTSATRRRSRAPPTSTRASSTATEDGLTIAGALLELSASDEGTRDPGPGRGRRARPARERESAARG